MVFNEINNNFGLRNGYGQQTVDEPAVAKVSPTTQTNLQDPWVVGVGKLVNMLKSKSDFGQVSDVLFRIPVLVNGQIEMWEYNSAIERDINALNFQQHVVNISDSICKWNTASQIYNEIIELRQMEYDNWKAKSMYVLRQQYSSDKKMTESALKECFIMENEHLDTPKRLELLYLNGTKNVIDNSIIKSLYEKSKHLITIGLQYRAEFQGKTTIGY
jgi:hypothetical protein